MAAFTPPPYVIAVDQREQLPFPLTGFAYIRKLLKTGDYSIVGLEHRVCVERKSVADMWGSMTQGRARFEKCVQRMAAMDRALIVVEGSLAVAEKQPSYIQRVNAGSVIGGLISWMAQYGVPVVWCDDRAYAERVTLRFLAAYWKHRRDDEQT